MKAVFVETGKTLARIRKSKDMTQRQLAKIMKTHSQAVSNAERGLTMPPKRCLVSIKKALKLTKKDKHKLMLAVGRDAKKIAIMRYQKLF